MNLEKFKHCVNSINFQDLSKLKDIVGDADHIIMLGNGGSNAVTLHIAQDYTKVLGKRAMSFGDTSRMSCYANDFGWDHAYTKFLEHFAQANTLVILISSSGNSTNILNCAEYCTKNNLPMVTLSGFDPNNKLRSLYSDQSLIHFWVDSTDYGIVECCHELILHSVI